MNSILDWFKGADTKPAGNEPDALHDELHQTLTMYGVTNRKVSPDGKSLVDSRLGAPIDPDSVHYFKEQVELTGTAGDFQAVSNTAPVVISKQEFDQGVASQVHAAHGKLGIFTHGIRTASGEAGSTAAELAADTGQPFVTEDWAATKAFGLFWAAHQEKSDDVASFQSQPMIDANVEDLVSKYGAGNIDMVAHSRGSMNQIRALADLQNKGLGTVHSATFAHSDVDVSDFETALPAFENAAGHVNVLYNNHDHVLKLSEIQRFGQIAQLGDNSSDAIEQSSRLGRAGLSPGTGSLSFVASKVPNYFSLAKDVNDVTGHSFSPQLVSSMIENPYQYQSFSTLKDPSQVPKPTGQFLSYFGIGKAITAVPEFALRILSPQKAEMDIVSDTPEVQNYLLHKNGVDFAAVSPKIVDI